MLAEALAAERTTPFTAPYPPSWVDRLEEAVERLSIPWWSFYLLLAVATEALTSLALWWMGIFAAAGFHPMQFFLPALPAYYLALIHFLDREALAAMVRFRPVFRGGEGAFDEVVYRLTTLPAKKTLLITLGLSLVSIPIGMAEFAYVQTGGLDASPALLLAIQFILGVTGYAFFYHSLHQLRQINRIYRDHADVQLARVRPLYALARVTSLTAVGLVLHNYGWSAAQPGLELANPATIGEGVFSGSIALAVFVWPLWGAHRLLADAKEAALANASLRKQALLERLHGEVDSGKLDQMQQLNQALLAVNTELADLLKVATWPWAPDTVRNLLGAILLPVLLWLIQLVLGRVLQ